MESNPPIPFSAFTGRTVAGQINPPASKEVLDRLATSLSLPVSRSEHANKSDKYQGYAKDPKQAAMRDAYNHCTEIIRKHSKSFYFSARLLPAAKRRAIMALYAFCRTSDDLVDASDMETERDVAREKARVAFDEWATLARTTDENCAHPVAAAWRDTRTKFSIPAHLADELLAGIRMDLTIDRYETWDDLWIYCYRVASTVGLMSMYVTGAETLEAVPYAVQLGVALQLTNILRDIGDDAQVGRVYLPAEDMDRFGYTEEMLFNRVIDKSFIALVEFEIERAQALYRAAMPGIAMLTRDSRMAVAAAATVYRGILNKIRSANYDVFNKRAHLSTGEKLATLPGIWMMYRR